MDMQTGNNNIFLGYRAGATIITGSNNVFFGYYNSEEMKRMQKIRERKEKIKKLLDN